MGYVGSLGNLPRGRPRLIGRATELAEIKALLEANALVTITACGGVGKTCISLAVAAELNPQFTDGIWFVDLARVSDPALVPATVGALFELEIPPGEQGKRLLMRTLAAKRTLLILDNCEHVVEATAALASALIAVCSHGRLLATSREPLGIRGERVYKLPLLSTPASNLRLDSTRATSYDAIALFVARARAMQIDFRLTDENAETIATICRQLDGIALAIELAAARVSIISVSDIAQRLSDRFDLLTDCNRTKLPRQQTLRALIDWSYELLSPEEQLVFLRLSVFGGSWAAEAMGEVLADGDLDEDALRHVLSGLVRKSLVVDTVVECITRYHFLESVREYAAEKFLGSAERDGLHRRHAECFLGLANGANATYFTSPSKQWLLALESELGNFRSALRWSLTFEKDVRLGAALAGALVSFLLQFSPHESLDWTRKALRLLPPDTEPAIEAALWLGVALTGLEILPAHEMRAAAERAVALARTVANPKPLCRALRVLIVVLGSHYGEERTLASKLAAEAMASARALDDPIEIALVLRNGSLTMDNTNVVEKRAILEESSRLLLAHGNDLQTAIAFMWLAEYDFCHGGAMKALTYARDAMRFAKKSGSLSMLVQIATNFAQYAAGRGDWDVTRRAAIDAAHSAVKLGMDDQVTWAVQALAIASAGTGDLITSAQLLGFCDRRTGTLHSQRQAGFTEDILYRRLLVTLQGRLTAEDLDTAMLRGAKLRESDVLRLALGQVN